MLDRLRGMRDDGEVVGRNAAEVEARPRQEQVRRQRGVRGGDSGVGRPRARGVVDGDGGRRVAREVDQARVVRAHSAGVCEAVHVSHVAQRDRGLEPAARAEEGESSESDAKRTFVISGNEKPETWVPCVAGTFRNRHGFEKAFLQRRPRAITRRKTPGPKCANATMTPTTVGRMVE